MAGSPRRGGGSSGRRCRPAPAPAGRVGGGCPDGPDEVRLPGQRMADALDRLLDLNLESGSLPGEGGEKPHIVVAVDLDKLDVDPTAPTPWDPDPQARAARATEAAQAAANGTSGRPRYAWTGP